MLRGDYCAYYKIKYTQKMFFFLSLNPAGAFRNSGTRANISFYFSNNSNKLIHQSEPGL